MPELKDVFGAGTGKNSHSSQKKCYVSAQL